MALYYDTNLHTPIVPIGSTFRISGEALQYCIEVGKIRTAENRKHHVVDRNYSGRTGEAIDLQGVLGEHTFARLFHVQDMTSDTSLCSHKNDRFDGRIRGKKVDVKTTVNLHSGLLVTDWKADNPADAYVLMHITRVGRMGFYQHTTRAMNEALLDQIAGGTLTDGFVDVTYKGMIPSNILLRSKYSTIFKKKPAFLSPLTDLRHWHDIVLLLHPRDDED